MRLKKVLSGLLIGAAVAVIPVITSAETLKDALRSAYNHSGLLQQNRALLRAADEDVAQAVTTLRPVVSWVANVNAGYLTQSGTYDDSISLRVQAEWLLYDFGRNDLRVAALKETVLATRARLISIEQNVLSQAATAYFRYRQSLDEVALRKSNVGLIQEQLRAARDRFEVGEVTRTDVALAEARLASARAAQAVADGGRSKAAAEFRRIIGRNPGRLAAPRSLPKFPNSVDVAITTARRSHPALTSIQHQISAAELSVELTRLAKMPNVRGTTRADIGNGPNNQVALDFGLSIGGTLYSGGKTASDTRKALAQRDAIRGDLHNIRHTIEQNVRNSYVDLQVARASAEASEQQIRAAQVAFRGVREEASLGARTTLDVLDAEQELLDARTGLITAGVDQQIAAYNILASVGMLTAKSLGLGVQTYDPAEYYNLVKNAPSASSAQGQALDRVLQSIGNN